MEREPDIGYTQRMPQPELTSTREAFNSGICDVPREGATLHLREEELVASKEMRHLGDVQIRTYVEEVPHELKVEAFSEEVEVSHVPVNRVVSEREAPRQDGDLLVVPIYEEEIVVTKRLVLREELHVRRIAACETRVFEETLRRERLKVEDCDATGMVHERYPDDESSRDGASTGEQHEGFLENLRRKVMQP
ncbi:MAG: YsnF/AvaK domain-containing protein [Chloroflexi bacterium]|nr:YsnF/AvaK domain-containing protein [Chloroflexota bacterium]